MKKDVFDVGLVLLLLTLNIFHTLLWCFYCLLWTSKCYLSYYFFEHVLSTEFLWIFCLICAKLHATALLWCPAKDFTVCFIVTLSIYSIHINPIYSFQCVSEFTNFMIILNYFKMGISFWLFTGKLDFREHLFIFWDRKDRKSRKKEKIYILSHSLSKMRILTFRGKLIKNQI